MKILTVSSIIICCTTLLFSTIINIPADQPTIQQGLNIASEGDTVLVAAAHTMKI